MGISFDPSTIKQRQLGFGFGLGWLVAFVSGVRLFYDYYFYRAVRENSQCFEKTYYSPHTQGHEFQSWILYFLSLLFSCPCLVSYYLSLVFSQIDLPLAALALLRTAPFFNLSCMLALGQRAFCAVGLGQRVYVVCFFCYFLP